MRLINTTTFRLENGFYEPSLPRYAVLSHTWTWSTAPPFSSAEVSLRDMRNVELARLKPGWSKIYHLCRLARDAGIQYAWIDTCCVDRSSLAEVQEAANGALHLFEGAHVCYVYLVDLEASPARSATTATAITKEDLRACRWFWRSWTLVELLAGTNMQIHDSNWALCGTKDSLRDALAAVTGVDEYLLRPRPRGQLCAHLAVYTVAERMSWAARRQSTVPEDVAYSLIGLFGVSMSLFYGEGAEKAFVRLQEAIAEETNDLTLFAWRADPARRWQSGDGDGRAEKEGEGGLRMGAQPGSEGEMQRERGVLALHPSEFASAHMSTRRDPSINPEFTLTNKGLRMETRLYRAPSGDIVLRLNCRMRSPCKAGGGGADRDNKNGVAEIPTIATTPAAMPVPTRNSSRNRDRSSRTTDVLGQIQEHQAEKRGMPYSHLRVLRNSGQRSTSPALQPTPETPYGSAAASQVSLALRPPTTPNSISSHSPLYPPPLYHQSLQPQQSSSTTWASGAAAIADVGIYLRSHGNGVYTRSRPAEIASIEGWPVVDAEKATIYIMHKLFGLRFSAAPSRLSSRPPSYSAQAPWAPSDSFSNFLQAASPLLPPAPSSPPLPPLPAEAWKVGEASIPMNLLSFNWKGDLGLPRYFSHVRAQPEALWDSVGKRFVTAGAFGPALSSGRTGRGGGPRESIVNSYGDNNINNNNNNKNNTNKAFTACHLFQCEPDVQPRSFVVAYGLTRWGDRDTAWACVLCERKAPNVLAAAERGDLDTVGRLGCQAGSRQLMLKRERDFFPRTVSLVIGWETVRQVPVSIVHLKVDRWV